MHSFSFFFFLLSEREILLMLRLALVKRGLDRTQHSFLRALSSSANSVSPRIRAKSIHLHPFTIEKKSLYNFKESENRWRDYWSNNVPFCPEPQNKKVFSMVWSLYPANIVLWHKLDSSSRKCHWISPFGPCIDNLCPGIIFSQLSDNNDSIGHHCAISSNEGRECLFCSRTGSRWNCNAGMSTRSWTNR